MNAHRMFLLTRCAAAALVCTVLTGASPSPSLDRLLKRMNAASGAPYAHHVVSLLHDTAEGRNYDERFESDGLRFLVHRCDRGACTGTYFDGSRTFALNLNDTALPRDPSGDGYQRTMRAVASYAFTGPDFVAAGGVVRSLGLQVRRGEALEVLEVTAAGGIPLRTYVDPATSLIRTVGSAGDGAGITYRDYRRVDGVMLPFEIWRAGRLAQAFASRTLVPDPLVAPRGVVPEFGSALAALRMEGGSSTPVVPCSLAGVTARCLLDTGNSGLSVSLELAEKLGLEPFGEFEVRGIGRYVTGLVRTGPLRLGPATFPSANYVVLHDMRPYGYDVVLGADALASTRVTIDYARRELSVAPFDSRTEGNGIPLSFENFVPVVPVRLGALALSLAVDTGDESGINLSYDYYQEHETLFAARERAAIGGIGGTSEQLIGEIPSVQIGPFEVANQRIGATRKLQGTARGHLGSGFLSHFVIVLEYARARLGLTPRSGDRAVRTIP